MILPESMSHAARETARNPVDKPVRARTLYLLLTLAVLLGIAGTTASIIAAQTSAGSTVAIAAQAREAAQANTALLEQVARLEELNQAETEEHRMRNEALHADLCRLVYEVIIAAPTLRDAGIKPCRVEAK